MSKSFSKLPVKNTFIHFDQLPQFSAESAPNARRSQTLSPIVSPCKSGILNRCPETKPLIDDELEKVLASTPRGRRECSPGNAHGASLSRAVNFPDTPERESPLALTPMHPRSGPSFQPVPCLPSWACDRPNAGALNRASDVGTGSPPALGTQERVPLSRFGFSGSGTFGYVFRFTLRRADGVSLGLEVERDMNDRALLVRTVFQKGAVDAWNRQCAESHMGWKAVLPGDRIVQANKALGCETMLEEIKLRFLLHLVIAREGPGDVSIQEGGRAVQVQLASLIEASAD